MPTLGVPRTNTRLPAISMSSGAASNRWAAMATIRSRRMAGDLRRGGGPSQYPYAAGYVRECEALSARLGADAEVESHEPFLQRLRRDHGRKYKFWHLLGEVSAGAGDRGLRG